jgi:hypothetical protein
VESSGPEVTPAPVQKAERVKQEIKAEAPPAANEPQVIDGPVLIAPRSNSHVVQKASAITVALVIHAILILLLGLLGGDRAGTARGGAGGHRGAGGGSGPAGDEADHADGHAHAHGRGRRTFEGDHGGGHFLGLASGL